MASPSNPFEGMEDPDPTGIKTVAILHRNLFDEYLNIGFRRAEAVQLVCAFIAASAMEGMGQPD